MYPLFGQEDISIYNYFFNILNKMCVLTVL